LAFRPKAGAECGKPARSDLCGGRRATGVPTANPADAPPKPASPPRTVVEPLAPDRYRCQQTIDGETRELLLLVKDLLPDCDDAEITKRALRLLAEQELKRKFALTDTPRPARGHDEESRYVPPAVKREVYLRDLGSCAYVGPSGHRCGSRRRVEFHHVKPYEVGGEATVVNTELRCSVHDKYEAEVYFDRNRRLASLDAMYFRTVAP